MSLHLLCHKPTLDPEKGRGVRHVGGREVGGEKSNR